jgi:prevent-host-death family protein
MIEVSVTTFRNHIPDYLGKLRKGENIAITSRGKVIARLLPPVDERLSARKRLSELRTKCRIGDVVSPLDEQWEVCCADS